MPFLSLSSVILDNPLVINEELFLIFFEGKLPEFYYLSSYKYIRKVNFRSNELRFGNKICVICTLREFS